MKNLYLTIFGFGLFFVGMLSASIIISFNLSTNTFSLLIPVKKIEFADFVGILLACLAIITTFFGVFLGILSVYGYSAIDGKVRESAASAARDAVEMSLKDGGELYELTKKTIDQIAYRGVGLDESSGAIDPTEGEKDQKL